MASITDGNFLVYNQGKNPLVNFNFMLRVELAFDLPCKSVRAFSRELEYDFVQEGGLNDYVHMLRKPISKPFTLEIERYVGVDYIDPLPLGTDMILPMLLFVSRAHSQFIPGIVARTYVFTGCTVMKKTFGDLIADQSGLLVETTTIAYREMLCVDLPWSEVGDDMFGSSAASPKEAVTVDKTATDLKAEGQKLYDAASAAKTQVETDYKEADLTDLIQLLQDTLKALNGDVKAKAEEVIKAKQAFLDGSEESGTMKEQLSQAQKTARAKEQAEREPKKEYQKAKDALINAENALKLAERTYNEAAERVSNLEAQLKALNDQVAAISGTLPEDCRTTEAAKQQLKDAQKAVTESDETLKKLQQEYEALEKNEALKNKLQAEAAQKAYETAKEALYRERQDALTKAENALAQARQAQEAQRAPLEEKRKTAQEALDRAEYLLEAKKGRLAEGAEAAKRNAESAQQAYDDEEENNRALAQAVTDAENAYKEASVPDGKAVEDAEKTKNAQQTLDQVKKEKADSDARLEQRKAKLDEAKAAVPGEEEGTEEEEAAVTKAQEEVDAAQNALDDLPSDETALKEPSAKVEEAQKALDDLSSQEDTLLAEEKKAMDDAMAKWGNAPVPDVDLQTKAAEVEAAKEACNAARANRDKAEVNMDQCLELKEVQDKAAQVEADKKEKETEQKERSAEKDAAKAAAETAKTETDTAEQAVDTAVKATADARSAVQRLSDQIAEAEDLIGEAGNIKRRITAASRPLQNSISGLENRKESTKQALADCGTQLGSCNEANVNLQAVPDMFLPTVNTYYQVVRKLAKQTHFHEKQVRETMQHMEAARKNQKEAQQVSDDMTKLKDKAIPPAGGATT